jgi:flagellin
LPSTSPASLDTATLATAINSAIGSAATGTTTAAAAFKSANIVASVNTNADGTEQIAFTSSTQAFQVQANDQMSNALMGNISTGSTGASLATSVTGQAVGADSAKLTAGQEVNFKISGGGLANPVVLHLLGDATNDASAAAGVTALLAAVNVPGSALATAGITAKQDATTHQIVFTNSSNQQFSVQAAGDTTNLFGLGAYSLDSNSNTTTADYSTITSAAAYDNTGGTVVAGASASPQTTLQFSINGGTAISTGAIALDAGNATAGTNTSAGVIADTTITNANKAVSFTVDGHAVSVNLNVDNPAATATKTGTPVAGTNLASDHFLLTVAGQGTVDITLAANDANAAGYAADITGKLGALAGSITVTAAGTSLVFATVGTGKAAGFTLANGTGGTNALANMGFATGDSAVGTDATKTTVASMATQIQNKMNTDLLNTGAAATVSVVSGSLVITNNNVGADHSVSTITNATGPLAGGTLSNTTGKGLNRTGDNLAIAINTAINGNTTLAAAGLSASWASGTGFITIASNNSTSFRLNAGAAPTKATSVGTLDLTTGADFSKTPATLQVSVGGAAAQTVTLNQNYATAATLAQAITGQLTGAAASVDSINGKNYLQISDTTPGPAAANSVQVLSSGSANAALGFTDNAVKTGTNEVNIGFGVTNSSAAGNLGLAQAASALSVVNAAGTSQTGGLTFNALASGSGTQALTISGNNANGATQSLTVTLAATGAGTTALQNNGTGDNIDSAVAYINSQLQKTNNSTLQSIVAVKESDGGQEEINFVSPLKGFQVGVGTTTVGKGINAGVAETATGAVTGSASNISIDTQAGAQAAITAIGKAIAALGSAQAAVGKSENQLGYAVNLASSQITNFSAAESQIRDANVAQQAANLSKAQTLSQASIAAMAQANSAPQAVLSLLRG